MPRPELFLVFFSFVDYMLPYDCLFTWSNWQPLRDCWRGSSIPSKPGLYRIRRCGRSDLDYIGQTGNLKKRLGMLKGIYGDEMPYRDPHTAAPALWALRHSLACDFEVSVLPVEANKYWLQGLEALAISLYRQQERRSPTANFGRIVEGYSISSYRKAESRGGTTTKKALNHLPSIAPTGKLTDCPQSNHWCGHEWSDWQPLVTDFQISEEKVGLYRIRSADSSELLYIGQGYLNARLTTHLRNAENSHSAKGKVFAEAQPLQCSWVHNSTWHFHQRLELENDLIASHLLVTETIPPAQFLG